MSYLANFRYRVLAVGLMFVVSTPIVLADDAIQRIHDTNADWVKSFEQRDFATMEALFTPDSLLLSPNAPAVEGPKAVIEVWKSWAELPNVVVAWGADRVEVSSSGDMAYDYGWYIFDFDTENGRVKDKGKYIVVWKKVDGAWKVAADIFNTNLPAE